jgi:hypothetical protein
MRAFALMVFAPACSFDFSHDEDITITSAPMDIESGCTDQPPVTVEHDDGSITTNARFNRGDTCEFQGTWEGQVLDLQGDVQDSIGTGMGAVAWENADLQVSQLEIRQTPPGGDAWQDVFAQPYAGLEIMSAATFFVGEDPPDLGEEAALVIEIPEQGVSPGDPVVDADVVLGAVVDGWCAGDPRDPVYGYASGVVNIGNEYINTWANTEIEIRLTLALTIDGVVKPLGNEKKLCEEAQD